MKNIRTQLFSLLLLTSYLLAACGGALPAGVDIKPVSNDSAQVEFAGTVDAIDGDQWTVNGQVFKVSGQTQFAANFKVGDAVKVSAEIGPDGAVTARDVQVFDPAAQAQTKAQYQTQTQAQNSSLDGTVTPEPAQPQAQTQTQSQVQTQSQTQAQTGAAIFPELVGPVESISDGQWVVGGQTLMVTNTTQFKEQLAVGDLAKVHLVVNSDGTFSILEIEKAVTGSVPGWNDNANNNSNSSGAVAPQNSNGKDDHGKSDSGENSDHDGNDEHDNDDSGDDHDDDSGNGSGG